MPSLLLKSFPPLAASGRLQRQPERVVMVIAGPNPSFDYYLRPRFRDLQPLPVEVADLNGPPAGSERPALAGALVLFCRYTSRRWMDAVERHSDSIAGVGLFVDDDIDALAVDRSVPLAYRLRLWRLHLAHRARLAKCCDVLFAATPELARRSADAQPHLLTPIASDEDRPAATPPIDAVRVAFHSTSVHAGEHRWLRPVVAQALASTPRMTFETIAGWPLSWRWRGAARLSVAPAMPWPAYRADTQRRGADLLLAPLLPTRANAARSWTKRIDAMRLGAALLVSDPEVYRPDPEERALGMCIPPDRAGWATALQELVRDRERLARLRDLNRMFVMRESAAAQPLRLASSTTQ